MKITKKVLFSLGVLSALSISQPGAAREFAEIYTECGLGAMIAPKSEAVAAVTNVTWDSGTTAISSNISSPDSCQGGKAKTAAFIHQSYEQIATDLASGKGKYLDALLALSGCQQNAQPALVDALRSDFSEVVTNPEYANQDRYAHAKALFDIVNHRIDIQFSNSCYVG